MIDSEHDVGDLGRPIEFENQLRGVNMAKRKREGDTHTHTHTLTYKTLNYDSLNKVIQAMKTQRREKKKKERKKRESTTTKIGRHATWCGKDPELSQLVLFDSSNKI